MAKKNTDPLLHVAEGVFLHPSTCGSSIHYSITVDHGGRYGACMYGDITLRDCNRGVTWCADGDPELFIEKLDTAIGVLARARETARKAKAILDATKVRKPKKKVAA